MLYFYDKYGANNFLYAFYANSHEAPDAWKREADEAKGKFLNCYVMREFLGILFML